jgi:hypothetical protein
MPLVDANMSRRGRQLVCAFGLAAGPSTTL